MNREQWIEKCNKWKRQWPVIEPTYLVNQEDGINLYAVLNAVNQYSKSEDVLMGDAGSISYAGPVALNSKPNQRFVFNPAQADMGWALPAAIGVAAADAKQVISIIGDGSFMSNIQELAVARYHNFNIKFVILNNSGYLSIKNTQTRFFEGRVFGTSDKKGLWFPDFGKIAYSYEIEYNKVSKVEELSNFQSWLEKPGPMIIDCICIPEQSILPSQAFKNGKQAPLHDMTPFLDDDILKQEMFYKDLL